MTTKQPATALPFYHGMQTRFPTSAENAERERRFNAYPQLVETLRNFLAASNEFVNETKMTHGDLITERADEARALLRSLGEEV